MSLNKGVTLEGPAEPYFINPREWGRFVSNGEWGRFVSNADVEGIRIVGKAGPSGGGVTIRGANQIRREPLCSVPSHPRGPRGRDASRELMVGRGGAGEGGVWRGSVPTGPKTRQCSGDSAVPSLRQVYLILLTIAIDGLAPKDR